MWELRFKMMCVSVMSDFLFSLFFFFCVEFLAKLIIYAWLTFYIRTPDAFKMIAYMCSTDLYLKFNHHSGIISLFDIISEWELEWLS